MFVWSSQTFSAQKFRQVGLWACCLPALTVCTAQIPQPRTSLDLSRARLPFADLQLASLNGVNLQGADLRQAFLNRTQLRNADLRGGNLENADLSEANLQGANLQGANLRSVLFSNTNLYHADLRGARLEGASLDLARLGEADFTGASYDLHTTWPAGVDPIACGARRADATCSPPKRPFPIAFRLGRKVRPAERPTRPFGSGQGPVVSDQ